MSTASLPITVSVVAPEILAGASSYADRGTTAGIWGVAVYINGADVTADVLGEVTIEAEESAARVAEVQLYIAPSTALTIAAWTGKAVSIYVTNMSSGSAEGRFLLFTGVVDLPVFTPHSQALVLRCTDNRQSIMERGGNMISQWNGGWWSPAVFKRGPDGGAIPNDMFSTTDQAFDLTPSGQIRFTNWSSQNTPDLTFDSDDVLENSLAVDIAERSSIVNAVDINFQYRIPTLKSEGHLVSYDAISEAMLSFGYWVKYGNYFLQRAAVEAAISKAGGTLVSIDYIALPATAQSIPETDGFWLPNPPVDVQYCTGFDAVVAFDYSQESTEIYPITVSCQKSIDAIGAMRETMSGALEGVYDDPVAAEHAILLFKKKISSVPPKAYASIIDGAINTFAPEMTNETDRTAAAGAMECLIAIAMAKIYAAHRQNTVSFSVPLNPAIDLDKTIRVTADGVDSQGKVRRVVFRMNTESGEATSTVDLAICSVAGVGITHAWSDIVAPAAKQYGQGVNLDDTVITWNYVSGQDGVFAITFPKVDENERNLNEVWMPAATYAASIHEDLFTVTA